jgi:hypothetical protein
MIVGLILAGSVTGAVAALAALLLGQGIWTALLIYSGTGVLGVLAGAVLVAWRAAPASRLEADPRAATRPQRG